MKKKIFLPLFSLSTATREERKKVSTSRVELHSTSEMENFSSVIFFFFLCFSHNFTKNSLLLLNVVVMSKKNELFEMM
jgi:hypothetical protein